MEPLTLPEQWALAAEVVHGLRGWQPDDGSCRLESAAVVALGRAAAPAVEMRWEQQHDGRTARFGLVLSLDLLVEAQFYEESLHPPERPLPEDLLALLRLAVYEPHGNHPLPAQRLWFDYLP